MRIKITGLIITIASKNCRPIAINGNVIMFLFMFISILIAVWRASRLFITRNNFQDYVFIKPTPKLQFTLNDRSIVIQCLENIYLSCQMLHAVVGGFSASSAESLLHSCPICFLHDWLSSQWHLPLTSWHMQSRTWLTGFWPDSILVSLDILYSYTSSTYIIKRGIWCSLNFQLRIWNESSLTDALRSRKEDDIV